MELAKEVGLLEEKHGIPKSSVASGSSPFLLELDWILPALSGVYESPSLVHV